MKNKDSVSGEIDFFLSELKNSIGEKCIPLTRESRHKIDQSDRRIILIYPGLIDILELEPADRNFRDFKSAMP